MTDAHTHHGTTMTASVGLIPGKASRDGACSEMQLHRYIRAARAIAPLADVPDAAHYAGWTEQQVAADLFGRVMGER